MTQGLLFESGEIPAETAPKKKRRVSTGWEFADHACRHCMGRVMRRVNPDGQVVVRCAECGSSAVGEPQALCWCGVEVRGHGTVFECFRNPEVTLTTPQEVLVRERKVERAQPVVRRTNPVGSRSS